MEFLKGGAKVLMMSMHYDRCCKETRVHFGEKQQQAYGDGLIRNAMAISNQPWPLNTSLSEG
eukprot:363189-Chlamydomonas_euryale.AAC.4